MSGTGPVVEEGGVPQASVPEDELADFCARPACRREFRRTLGPGRRQAYCSEICRRSAEREFRQVAQRLKHFEGVVGQLRVDLAAFGRPGGSDDSAPEESARPDARANAAKAVARVGGILTFIGDSSEPLAKELRVLYEAVAPLHQD